MKLLARRGLAFLVDLNLYLLLWGVVDNLVAFALPVGVMELAKGASFALYFAAFTAVSAATPSPGKLLTGLRVVSTDAAGLTRSRVVRRGLVLGLLLVTSWPDVSWYVVWANPPLWFALAAGAIPRGLVLYGVVSALLDRSGLMPHDRWARTRVVTAGEADEPLVASAPPAPPLPARGRLALAGALVAVAMLVAFQGTVLTKGDGRWAVLARPQIAADDVAHYFERMMYKVVGVRSRVEFKRAEYRRKSGPASREVRIRVWLPFAAMNTQVMENALRATFANMWLTDATCDTVRVVFWSGEEAAKIELESAIGVPPLPEDRGFGGAEDTLCVPVSMPPTTFHAQAGPFVYEPVFESHANFDVGVDGRLLLKEGPAQGLLRFGTPYTLRLCIRLRRPSPGPSAMRTGGGPPAPAPRAGPTACAPPPAGSASS